MNNTENCKDELATLELMKKNGWKCQKCPCGECFYCQTIADDCALDINGCFNKNWLQERYQFLKKQCTRAEALQDFYNQHGRYPKYLYHYDQSGLTLTDNETGKSEFLQGDEANELYDELDNASVQSQQDIISEYFTD